MNNIDKLNIEIVKDENEVPEKITWESVNDNKKQEIKAMFFSGWDKEEKITYSINIWSKEMKQDEMKVMFIQTLLSMSESLNSALTSGSLFGEEVKKSVTHLSELLKKEFNIK